jgi:uncharacterized DUF497 family protein
MRFEWDVAKNRANQNKHGIDFETAVHVFNDPNHLLIKDRIDEKGEQRWHALGVTGDVPLLVVHVYRSTHDGEEIIRIISARKANQRESRRYFR